MKEQKRLIRWIKVHKKELIIAGVSITAIIAAVLLYRNRKSVAALWRTLLEAVNGMTVSKSAANSAGEATKAATDTVVAVEEVAQTFEETAKKYETILFEVSSHLRNLSGDRSPSPEKVASAAEHGFDLGPHQTWVEPYWKGGTAA